MQKKQEARNFKLSVCAHNFIENNVSLELSFTLKVVLKNSKKRNKNYFIK